MTARPHPSTMTKREAAVEFAQLMDEVHRRKQIDDCKSLMGFVHTFWHVLEPVTVLEDGWALEAMCQHLEAVTDGRITRLLINVSPGSMKSLLVNTFWPAWEWSRGLGHLRTVNFSYAAHLTQRDNAKFRDIVTCPLYGKLFGSLFKVTKAGEVKIQNSKTGWKLASSIGGVSTGERGDRVVLDDPHNVKQAESDLIRKGTVEWFGRSMSSRLNNMETSAIVVIMQRVHEDDVSGYIIERLEELGYVHLCIPAEFDGRACETVIGYKDPRTKIGELYWPERFSRQVLERQKMQLGPFSYSGQYQQSPEPMGGGILKRDYWNKWDHDTAIANGCRSANTYPPFSFILASLDTAYTAKEENDASALGIFGIWEDRHGNSKIMLMAGWAERLEFDELVTKVGQSCKQFRVSKILIENKAAGHSVAQSLRKRLQTVGDELAQNPKTEPFGQFAIQLFDPKKYGDKVARAYAVQHLFTAGLVYTPEREWADKFVDDCALFPKGTHDDRVDVVTQALQHLRTIGLALLPDESRVDDFEARRHRPKVKPLYGVLS